MRFLDQLRLFQQHTNLLSGLRWSAQFGASAGTVDTGTGDGAGDGDGEGDGAAEEGLGIAEAGERWLSELSPEERVRPLGGGASEDDGEGEAPPVRPAKKPAKKEEDGEGDAGQQGDDDAGDQGDGGEVAGTVVKVILKGLEDRGEEDFEVDVDPETAERIQRLQNDGVRAKDVRALKDRVDAAQAKIDDYKERMDMDPVGFHIEQMPVDAQLDVARALFLEHFEALAPEFDKLAADREERFKAREQSFNDRRANEKRFNEARQTRASVQAVVKAVEKLVPAHVDLETAEQFVYDARQDLARMSRGGTRVEPQLVKRLLARRLALYETQFAPPKAKSAKGSESSARPLSDRARQIAEAAPGKARAADAQARVRSTTVRRRAAARTLPPGAGAAPVKAPAAPKEAEADIASMSKYLRTPGKLPNSWKQPRD